MFTKGQKLSKSKLYSGNFFDDLVFDDDAMLTKKKKIKINLDKIMLKDLFEMVFFYGL